MEYKCFTSRWRISQDRDVAANNTFQFAGNFQGKQNYNKTEL